jgi:hypothetical protein
MKFLLVPKLCLGTHYPEAPPRESQKTRAQEPSARIALPPAHIPM